MRQSSLLFLLVAPSSLTFEGLIRADTDPLKGSSASPHVLLQERTEIQGYRQV